MIEWQQKFYHRKVTIPMKTTMKHVRTPVLLLVALMLLLMTGCAKTEATTATFQSLAESKGYLTNDVIEQFADYRDTVKEATVAAPQSVAFKLEFYVLADDTAAKNFFANNKATLESNQSGIYSQSSVNISNYQSYSLTASGQYMFIERVGKTVLVVFPTDSGNKKEIEEFVKQLNY